MWILRCKSNATLLLWWICGLLVIFLFGFNGSVCSGSFFSQLYRVYATRLSKLQIFHLLHKNSHTLIVIARLSTSGGSHSQFERRALHAFCNECIVRLMEPACALCSFTLFSIDQEREAHSDTGNPQHSWQCLKWLDSHNYHQVTSSHQG